MNTCNFVCFTHQ